MQDWAVSPCMPPLPEGVIPREVLEEDESESTVPSDVEEEAPESSGPELASVRAARIRMHRPLRLRKVQVLVQSRRSLSFL